MFESTINSDVFHAWLTQDLLPKVLMSCVIVMDNASFHKCQDIIKTINDHDCILEFLPPYSPDLNPIEHKWAQAKAIRKQHHCNVDDLFSVHMKDDILFQNSYMKSFFRDLRTVKLPRPIFSFISIF